MGIFTRKTNGIDKIGTEVEGDIRELISRDVIEQRRNAPLRNDSDSDMIVHDLGALLQRVSLNSVQEIDDLISELKELRDQLQHNGERMAREIAGYANLSQTAMRSTRILSESLNNRKNGS